VRHGGGGGRDLHWSTFQLNLTRLLSLTPTTVPSCPTERTDVEPIILVYFSGQPKQLIVNKSNHRPIGSHKMCLH